jgi:hypothetical protein
VNKSIDLFKFASEHLLQKLEAEPITVDVRLADGTITMEIPPKHPWFKELNARKAEQLKRLRASFKPGDQHKLSQKPKTKKETAASQPTKTADSVYQNDTNSRATK